MNFFKTTAIAAAVFAMGSAASAATYDFKEMADGAYGESAYDVFNVGGLSITAEKNSEPALVYLDANDAGMGVCGSLKDGEDLGPNPGSGANVCSDASDDSIQWEVSEILTFTALGLDVILDAIWVNFNHDPSSGEESAWSWTIDGEEYTLADMELVPDAGLSGSGDYKIDLMGLEIEAGHSISIFLNAGPNSYLSGISATAVPLPAAGWLLLGGLGGMVALKRRKKA